MVRCGTRGVCMDVSGYIDHGGMYGGMEGLEGLEVDDGWVGGKNEKK